MEKIFITGGSGTVGYSFIRNNFNKYKIYSYSRNEKAQIALKRNFPQIEIVLGSVEDKFDLNNAIAKIKPQIIIHAAALKHVDTAEKQPIEMVKSNIIGSKNVIEASKYNNIPITIGISTDKACNPKNLYGYSKTIMEKMFLEANNQKNIFCCTRFGNVAGSNGSVIPFWLNCKKNDKPLPITDKRMSRLMLNYDEVSEIIEKSIEESKNGHGGFVLTKKMKKVLLFKLANIISTNTTLIGLRPGEELYEDLISESELEFSELKGEYILIRNEHNQNRGTRLKESISSDTATEMSDKEIFQMVEFIKSNSFLNEHY
tara:strand:+ start:1830 stop:2777 length:948 start_codon:yes stop_codon:yes gene_type:complete